jgi:hypothetical protein
VKKASFATLLLFLFAGSSQAQPAVTNSSRSELLRVLASEARWDAPRSHAAMLHVLGRYAERNSTTLVGAADKIIWPFSNAQYDHPWVRYLDESCEKPDYYRYEWPREKCLAMLAMIDRFVDGKLADPCNGKASGWRSPGSKALRYALAHGFSRVKCRRGTSLAFVQPRRQNAERPEPKDRAAKRPRKKASAKAHRR